MRKLIAVVAFVPIVVGCAADRAERVAAEPTVTPAATATPATPAATESAPAQARITCTKDGKTILETPAVLAQEDGVHVRVDNQAGEPTTINGTRLDVYEGVSEHVESLAPGTLKIACWPGSKHGGPEPARHNLAILDPSEHWIDPELKCGDGRRSSTIYDGVGKGSRDNPIAMARASMKWLRDDDVVELAAYPKAPIPTVRVVRDGLTIAMAGFEATDTEGNYVLSSVDRCSDADAGN